MRLAVSLSLIVAVAGPGCVDHCDGGIWQTGTTAVCTGVTGSATVTSPANYGIPANLPLVTGRSCVDAGGTCSGDPIVHLATLLGPGQFGIDLFIRLPAMEGGASYTIPAAWTVPYFSVLAGLTSNDAAGTFSSLNLEVVSGTVEVQTSTPDELRLSFELGLELLSSMETFAITGGVAIVSGCHPVETRQCVKGADN